MSNDISENFRLHVSSRLLKFSLSTLRFEVIKTPARQHQQHPCSVCGFGALPWLSAASIPHYLAPILLHNPNPEVLHRNALAASVHQLFAAEGVHIAHCKLLAASLLSPRRTG